MKIQCPSCGVKGEVADGREESLKPLRCRKCGAKFQLKPPAFDDFGSPASAAASAEEPIFPDLSVPPPGLGIHSDEGPPSWGSKWTPALAAGLAIVLFVVLGFILFRSTANDAARVNGPIAAGQRLGIQPQPDDPDGSVLHFDARPFVAIVILACCVSFYLLPSFIAVLRKHQNAAAITVLNIFLGWTFAGWVAALVWAFTEVRSRHNYHHHTHAP